MRDSARDLYLRAALGVGGDSRAELGRALQAARARRGASAATLRPWAVGPDALPELLARAFAHSPFRPDVAQQQALDALASVLGAEAPNIAGAPRDVGESSVQARALMLRAHAARVSVGSALCAEMEATLIEAPALLESFFQVCGLGCIAAKFCMHATDAPAGRRRHCFCLSCRSISARWPYADTRADSRKRCARRTRRCFRQDISAPPRRHLGARFALGGTSRAILRAHCRHRTLTRTRSPRSPPPSRPSRAPPSWRRSRRRLGPQSSDAPTKMPMSSRAWMRGQLPTRARRCARAAVAGEVDDAKVHTGDVVTISIDLEVATRRVATLGDGRVLAHAPRLAHADKAEVWLVILCDARGRLRGVRPAPPLPGGSTWSTELQVRFGAAEVGQQTLRALAVCGACEGADASANVHVEVLPPPDLFDGEEDDFSDDRSDGDGAGMSLSDDEDLDSDDDDSGSED